MKTKALITALLDGGHIAKRPNRRKGFGYALFKQKAVPYEAISDIQFSTLKNVFKEKKGCYTFNLNLVRQMHGKALPKVLYKQSKKKSNAAS